MHRGRWYWQTTASGPYDECAWSEDGHSALLEGLLTDHRAQIDEAVRRPNTRIRMPAGERPKASGGFDGGAGVYVLSRQQFQRWSHVDRMSPTELQEKYRLECVVYAHRANLARWLKVSLHKQGSDVGICISC